jgi:hypothetical protein
MADIHSQAANGKSSVSEFTSQKLDQQRCIVADPRLKPVDKLVAIYILHRVNVDSRIAFPSAQTISDETCVGRRHVLRALKRLKQAGWLVARRRWQTSSTYRISDKNVNAIIDRLLVLKEAREAGWKRKAFNVTQESPHAPYAVTQESPDAVTQESPKHLRGNTSEKKRLSRETRTLRGEAYGGSKNGAATFHTLPAFRRLPNDRPIYVPAVDRSMRAQP